MTEVNEKKWRIPPCSVLLSVARPRYVPRGWAVLVLVGWYVYSPTTIHPPHCSNINIQIIDPRIDVLLIGYRRVIHCIISVWIT